MNYPRVHDVCKTKLFAIVRLRQFFCRECRVFLTILDGKGDRIGPGINPVITEEQIKTMTHNSPAKYFPGKVIYRLVSRPTGDRE